MGGRLRVTVAQVQMALDQCGPVVARLAGEGPAEIVGRQLGRSSGLGDAGGMAIFTDDAFDHIVTDLCSPYVVTLIDGEKDRAFSPEGDADFDFRSLE